MPPKKRKKTYDENQLGSTRSDLQQYFSTLPQTTSLLKNGHSHLKGKQQKKDRQARGKIERKIDGAIANVPQDFDLELVTLLPDVDKALPQRVVQDLADLPSLVGRYVYHVWDMGEEGDVLYYGKIVELKTSKKKPAKVRISYWLPEESEEDSEDSTFKVSAVLTDFLLGDLSYST